jgi:hypothetical protein
MLLRKRVMLSTGVATPQLQRQTGILQVLPASQQSSRHCSRRAVRPCAASSASSFDPSSDSIPYPYNKQHVQLLQQCRQQVPQQPSEEESDLLWAGYRYGCCRL